ncbi:MAG: SIS domain-containing protein, partial [bacterium]|nr:SIS domain-containing protein [bacterium]
MMKDAISSFASQFSWQPKIVSNSPFPKYKRFLLAGMGGSHLSGDILKLVRPELDFIIHSSYGLPKLSKQNFKKRLFVANSYSGNTEEVISGLYEAEKIGLPILVIATGGKLIEIAKGKNYPYIELSITGIQPRMSLGYGLRALALVISDKKLLRDSEKLAVKLRPLKSETKGKQLALRIKNKIPIIYSSADNLAIAYNWKIKFNETAKSPAFYNLIPELNHNEMTGFDLNQESKHLTDNL